MAGKGNTREENFENKHLRKILGQVDNRIQVPASLNADSLRSLLDNIEPATPREVAGGRPRWLSLQSGIAYAAAFALIIALFYSTKMYRPEIIDGGMYINESASMQSAVAFAAEDAPEDGGTVGAGEAVMLAGTAQEPVLSAEGDDDTVVIAERGKPKPKKGSGALGVGGGGESRLLTQQDTLAYYARTNDMTDPDRTSPVTLEVVDTASGEIIAQLNLDDTNDIEQCFIHGDKLLIVGESGDGLTVHVYDDGGNPAEPLEQTVLMQSGAFVKGNLHDNVAYIISQSTVPPEGIEAVALPGTSTSGTCIVTAVNLDTLEIGQKAFTGATKSSLAFDDSGDIQILYEGAVTDDNDRGAYENRILLDDVNIELEVTP